MDLSSYFILQAKSYDDDQLIRDRYTDIVDNYDQLYSDDYASGGDGDDDDDDYESDDLSTDTEASYSEYSDSDENVPPNRQTSRKTTKAKAVTKKKVVVKRTKGQESLKGTLPLPPPPVAKRKTKPLLQSRTATLTGPSPGVELPDQNPMLTENESDFIGLQEIDNVDTYMESLKNNHKETKSSQPLKQVNITDKVESLVYEVLSQHNTVMAKTHICDHTSFKAAGIRKPQIEAAIVELTKKGYLIDAGAGRAYHINQEYLPQLSHDALHTLERMVQYHSYLEKKLNHELSQIHRLTSVLSQQPPTSQLPDMIHQLKARVASKQTKIATIKSALPSSGNTSQSDALREFQERRDQLCKQFLYVLKEWKSRKEAAYAMMDPYLEAVSKKRAIFMREIGVDSDEDHRVDMKHFFPLRDQVLSIQSKSRFDSKINPVHTKHK